MNTREAIANVCDSLRKTLLEKNEGYGNSSMNAPLFLPNQHPKSSVLIRMSDKVNRLRSLAEQGKVGTESFNDTILDLAGYCVLYFVCDKIHESEDK